MQLAQELISLPAYVGVVRPYNPTAFFSCILDANEITHGLRVKVRVSVKMCVFVIYVVILFCISLPLACAQEGEKAPASWLTSIVCAGESHPSPCRACGQPSQ